MDNIKINDNDDMAEDDEPSRDSPIIQETIKSNKDRPKERQTKKKEERTEDDAAREAAKKKGLGTFFDKVISSLKTVTAPAPVPPPPQPPLPPQPVPSPYLHAAPPPPRAPPQQQPPPPAPPSPSRIPLPPATPRYTESPEPGEITEAEERREVGHRQPPPPPPPAASTRPILRRTVTEVTPTITGAVTSGEMGEVETGLGRGSGNTVRVQKITGRDFPMAAMISTQGTGAGATETGGRTMVTGGPRLQTMLTRSLRGWTSS